MQIKNIHAQEILDSRGNPTIETIVTLEDNSVGISSVPSGASTGEYEAVELRDGDSDRYAGKGVLQAIHNVNIKLRDVVVGMNAEDQLSVDKAMIDLDASENKSNLGANAILSISLGIARAQASSEKKELYEYLTKFNPEFIGSYIMPIPEMNVMNGGRHANWTTDIQEYMLFPIGASTFVEAVRMNVEVYHALEEILKQKKYATSVGDEGGFAPAVQSNEEPFQLLSAAVEKAGYSLRTDIAFGIDAASSEFFKEGRYILNKEGKSITGSELGSFFLNLVDAYPIISIEDVFDQNDWESFQSFTAKSKDTMQIVGDDLYVTNEKRLQKGIEQKASNAILIKLNQIGTLTETINTMVLAKKHHIASIVSHRSGDTEDTFIADLAVAMCNGQIKSGAPARSERVAKYNRLMRIERQLGKKAQYHSFR